MKSLILSIILVMVCAHIAVFDGSWCWPVTNQVRNLTRISSILNLEVVLSVLLSVLFAEFRGPMWFTIRIKLFLPCFAANGIAHLECTTNREVVLLISLCNSNFNIFLIHCQELSFLFSFIYKWQNAWVLLTRLETSTLCHS